MLEKLLKRIKKFYYLKVKRDSITYAKKLGVNIGSKCQILADPDSAFGTEPWLIRLGNHVDITYGVHFLNHEGGIWCARGIDSEYDEMDLFKPTYVGDNVMIGMYSIIMPGVHIGNNVIIGGHSVVTKDIPDGVVVAGIPAKQISTIEKFMEKLPGQVVPTKHLSQPEKYLWLKRNFPEWFEELEKDF